MRPLRRLLLTLAACASLTHVAHAGDWRYEPQDESERALARLRYTVRADLWVARYDRPQRACAFSFDVAEAVALPTPPGGGGCDSSRSDEVGVGPGLSAEFRVIGPLYITAGIDLLYSTPDSSALKSQVIVPIPLGLLVTPYNWTLRPLLRAQVTPLIYLTDDTRDFATGIDGGFALRATDWGDLSLTIGYHKGETLSSWQVEFGLHPIP